MRELAPYLLEQRLLQAESITCKYPQLGVGLVKSREDGESVGLPQVEQRKVRTERLLGRGHTRRAWEPLQDLAFPLHNAIGNHDQT